LVYEQLPLLLMLAPLCAAALSLLGKLLPAALSRWPAFIIWAGGSAGLLLIAAPPLLASASLSTAVGGWAEPYGIELELNGMAWITLLLALIIGTAVWREASRSDSFGPLFFLLFYTSIFALTGAVCSRDLFNLFIWFEIISLCSFVLIAYEQHARSLIAAFRYLLISTVSIIFYLLGLWLLYRHTGSLSIGALASLSDAGIHRPELGAALALIGAGILTRSALFPFHTWLPEAHSAAPYPVSALLSGLVVKAPVVALAHMRTVVPFPELHSLLLILGLGGALLGAVGAWFQRDVKLLLGYSSVSHMGLIIALLGADATLAPAGMLLYILSHGLAKALLFLTLGGVSARYGTRDIEALRGSLLRHPLHCLVSLIGLASLIGIPFTLGYPAKHLATTLIAPSPVPELLLTAVAVFSASAMLRLLLLCVPARTGQQPAPVRPNHSLPLLGPLLLAGAILLAGIVPQQLMTQLSLLAVAGGSPPPGLSWYGMQSMVKLGAVLALAILLAAGLRHRAGRVLSARVRSVRIGLDTSLRLLLLGMLLFLLFGLLSV
jgi:multicomponent Na+:H+ antiporter subunit D